MAVRKVGTEKTVEDVIRDVVKGDDEPQRVTLVQWI